MVLIEVGFQLLKREFEALNTIDICKEKVQSHSVVGDFGVEFASLLHGLFIDGGTGPGFDGLLSARINVSTDGFFGACVLLGFHPEYNIIIEIK